MMNIAIEIDEKFKELKVLIQSPDKKRADEIADILTMKNHGHGKVPILTEFGYEFIPESSIEYIEVLGMDITYHLKNKEVISKGRLYKVLDDLNPQLFIQIHKSYIINIEKIISLENYFSGNMIANMASGKKVSVSRRYLNNLKSKLGITSERKELK